MAQRFFTRSRHACSMRYAFVSMDIRAQLLLISHNVGGDWPLVTSYTVGEALLGGVLFFSASTIFSKAGRLRGGSGSATRKNSVPKRDARSARYGERKRMHRFDCACSVTISYGTLVANGKAMIE